jgi:hypothetical protein
LSEGAHFAGLVVERDVEQMRARRQGREGGTSEAKPT